jgi:hypothetical protein
MNSQPVASRHGLFGLGAMLSVGMIVSTFLAAAALQKAKLANQTISVKGCAEREIESDVVTWQTTIWAEGAKTDDAYRKLKGDVSIVLGYLKEKGVPEGAMTVSSIYTAKLYARNERGNLTDTVTGYRLSQCVRVRSGDIEKVTGISRECTDLIAQGVEIDSSSPEYFYTKLNELKIAMLGEAARDARRRAEQLARDSGSKVGALRSASQGVFQVTPVDSTEVSDCGINDTSSITKKVRAVVTVRYSIR